MSDTYTKLFSSITESTVWGEPYATRIVWVTLLAMADARGNVYGAVPGIARRANVTLAEAEAALAAFLSPDPYSRTKDSDGRRIEEIDGGWRLINHGKYSAVRNADERREYKRQWDQENRPSGHARTGVVRQQSDSSPTGSDKSDRPDPTNTNTNTKKKEQKPSAQPAATRFDDWWAAYPKKVGKKPALQKWRSRGLDAVADALIADVLHRAANDDGWLRGYVPDPLTYLNQDRWEDDLRAAPVARSTAPALAAPSKTLTAIQTLQAMKHGHLDSRRDSGRADEVALLESGAHPRR